MTVVITQKNNIKTFSALLRDAEGMIETALSDELKFAASDLRARIVENILNMSPKLDGAAKGREDDPRHPGRYRDSWEIRRYESTVAPGFTTSYSVYTREPESRRLELGFIGRASSVYGTSHMPRDTDALGRKFPTHQPMPHIEPAIIDESHSMLVERLMGERGITAAIAERIARKMGRSS